MLAIVLPSGAVITDPEWECMADVMRSAHGQGVTRMPGRLVELDQQLVRVDGIEPPTSRV